MPHHRITFFFRPPFFLDLGIMDYIFITTCCDKFTCCEKHLRGFFFSLFEKNALTPFKQDVHVCIHHGVYLYKLHLYKIH
jgi:hypothetical protein